MTKKTNPSKRKSRPRKGGAEKGRAGAPTPQKIQVNAGRSPAHDHLVRGLKLFTAQDFKASFDVMTEAATLYPEEPAVHENLGVVLMKLRKFDASIAALNRALELGSDSLNIHDALCGALGHVGKMPDAIRHGRLSLEAKDRKFGAQPPICKLPKAKPPEFNGQARGENVIAYSLWGTNQRYYAPLQENLRIAAHLFPAWTIRIYHDADVAQELLSPLAKHGAQLQPMTLPAGEPPHRRLLWRFKVWSDPGVKRFLVRDADSLFSVKERVAVDDWLRSGRYFHAMRDFFTHTDVLLAGMFGGVGGVLPPIEDLLKDFRGFRLEGDHVDQDFLTVRMWPTVRNNCLIHDSVFTGCLGSVPFPPYGALPAGHHIGQNAFIHFRKTK